MTSLISQLLRYLDSLTFARGAPLRVSNIKVNALASSSVSFIDLLRDWPVITLRLVLRQSTETRSSVREI